MGNVSSQFSRDEQGKRTSPARKGDLESCARDHVRSEEQVKKHTSWGNWGRNLRCVDRQLGRDAGHKECGRNDGKNVRFHCGE